MKNIRKRKFLKFIIPITCIIILLMIVVINKSYAIYKIQKEFNIIKKQVGTYEVGDIKVVVKVDGEEVDTFPSYETNYKIESVECSNGVIGEWSVVNWTLNISNISKADSKCIINFDSTRKNVETPIAYKKSELVTINEQYKSTTFANLVNKIYPVGSIYITTTENTIAKVKEKFGGTWESYSGGRTLIGANSSYAVNSTGGSSTVTLRSANLPSHTHSIPTSSITTSAAGAHTPTIYTRFTNSGFSTSTVSGYVFRWSSTIVDNTGNGTTTLYNAHLANLPAFSAAVGNHTHTVTKPASTTGATGSGTAINIQNPYTAVYMYKRTA